MKIMNDAIESYLELYSKMFISVACRLDLADSLVVHSSSFQIF